MISVQPDDVYLNPKKTWGSEVMPSLGGVQYMFIPQFFKINSFRTFRSTDRPFDRTVLYPILCIKNFSSKVKNCLGKSVKNEGA